MIRAAVSAPRITAELLSLVGVDQDSLRTPIERRVPDRLQDELSMHRWARRRTHHVAGEHLDD